MSSKKFNLLKDVYCSDEYIRLYLKEDEDLFKFEYKDGKNIFLNKTIKKPIRKIGDIVIDDGYYDLEGAYGYGGFYTNSSNRDFISTAMRAYEKKCLEENIIAEFIRFHPFNDFSTLYSNFLDFNIYDRDTIIINLAREYEHISLGYSSSLKRNINKAKRNGLRCMKLNSTIKNMAKFYSLYNKTMEKNNATEFYFFKFEYFEKLLEIKEMSLYAVFYDNQVINMIIVFQTNGVIYYHLGATDPNCYSLNPNPLIFDYLIQIFSEKYEYLYMGGGATSNKDDSLLKFKQKFSKKTKPFYIGGKVYNQDIYKKYNSLWQKQSKEDIEYFLKYRLEIK